MSTATIDTSNTIFRFKFTPEFTSELLSFAKLHQYDDRVTYKENWSRWVQLNDGSIDAECCRMKALGYEGNVIDKMYKSGRYYFRKKTPKQEPKTRRKYVSIDKEVIDAMDIHISQHYGTPMFKPSVAHDLFWDEYDDLIGEESARLVQDGLTKEDINVKIKKTYKNRCFLFFQHYQINHCRDDFDLPSTL